MKKSLIKTSVILCVFSIIALSVAGCAPNNNQKPTDISQKGDQELSGSIQVAGSTSVQPLSEELAREFMNDNPKIRINVAGGGSGAGIKSAQSGAADIGTSSRELKSEEKNVKEILVAKDGIAVVVSAKTPLEELTMEQVKKVFSGEISNWKDLGGPDNPITVIIREDGSGTRGAFQEIVLGKEGEFTDKAIIQNSTGALRTAVAGNPDAIGFISLGALNDDVKALKIDGVEISKENILNNSYKLSRPFLYLTKDEPQGIVKSFIDFVLSPKGQEIVGMEFIPVK